MQTLWIICEFVSLAALSLCIGSSHTHQICDKSVKLISCSDKLLKIDGLSLLCKVFGHYTSQFLKMFGQIGEIKKLFQQEVFPTRSCSDKLTKLCKGSRQTQARFKIWQSVNKSCCWKLGCTGTCCFISCCTGFNFNTQFVEICE